MLYSGDATGYVVIGIFLSVIGIWKLLAWINAAPVRPDPWDTETSEEIEQAGAAPVCHRCLTPQKPGSWFCERCNAAVGPYNNMMPYLNVFSEGEVFRNGLSQRVRNRPLVITGYLLLSLSTFPVIGPLCLVFTASYLLSVIRNHPPVSRRQPDAASTQE